VQFCRRQLRQKPNFTNEKPRQKNERLVIIMCIRIQLNLVNRSQACGLKSQVIKQPLHECYEAQIGRTSWTLDSYLFTKEIKKVLISKVQIVK
jgi:hypothetical protein